MVLGRLTECQEKQEAADKQRRCMSKENRPAHEQQMRYRYPHRYRAVVIITQIALTITIVICQLTGKSTQLLAEKSKV